MTLLFDGTFEDMSKWSTICRRSVDLSLLPNPRTGKLMARFRVDQNSICASGNRYELKSSNFAAQQDLPNIEREGHDRWYSMSMKLDPSWTSGPSDTTYHIFSQWHGTTTLSPSLALDVKNVNGQPSIRVSMCAGVSPATSTPTSNCAHRLYQTILPIVVKNVWQDFIIHVLWSETAGIVEIFHKTESQTQYTTIFNISAPTLQKIVGYESMIASRSIGLYRSGGYADTDILYISHFKMGTTRADVEISPSPPLPTPTPTPPPISTPTPDTVPLKISLNIESNPVGAKIIVNGVAVN